ncbi:Alternative oxidase, mitochondrial precursor [Saguinus oedipus]|uniref:Alternative oxidase, mitochondrial n=1 Tax=Saguinus oedipus TaxID=9490 RepID=A0ABQ9VHI9_SAGOE|nr:Alternative oxidase, mitochondrial precursor [Saguinus oedipus]
MAEPQLAGCVWKRREQLKVGTGLQRLIHSNHRFSDEEIVTFQTTCDPCFWLRAPTTLFLTSNSCLPWKLTRMPKSVTEKNVDPETMLLPYLRKKRILSFTLSVYAFRLTGTKYGCGGGGCGACTVMISRYNPITKRIRHHPANACLIPICSLYGAAVTTVEGIGSTHTRIHPVQERIAKCHGTQCGFCTPGMVMSIYTLLRNHPEPTLDQLTDALGAEGITTLQEKAQMPELLKSASRFLIKYLKLLMKRSDFVDYVDSKCQTELSSTSPKLFTEEEFLPLDSTQELIFPPELMEEEEE